MFHILQVDPKPAAAAACVRRIFKREWIANSKVQPLLLAKVGQNDQKHFSCFSRVPCCSRFFMANYGPPNFSIMAPLTSAEGGFQKTDRSDILTDIQETFNWSQLPVMESDHHCLSSKQWSIMNLNSLLEFGHWLKRRHTIDWRSRSIAAWSCCTMRSHKKVTDLVFCLIPTVYS